MWRAAGRSRAQCLCQCVGERVTGVAGALVQTGLAFEFYLVTMVCLLEALCLAPTHYSSRLCEPTRCCLG